MFSSYKKFKYGVDSLRTYEMTWVFYLLKEKTKKGKKETKS